MPAKLNIQLDRRFEKQAKGRYEKYQFDVGILKDRPHLSAASKKKGLKSYAGGPARKVGRSVDGTMSSVSESLRKHLRINFYTKPFRSRKNKDILAFTKAFLLMASGKGSQRRVVNLLQAIVRNPILRGDYGKNRSTTAKIKGFNRLMIDTSQLFKAIQAKVTVKRVSE